MCGGQARIRALALSVAVICLAPASFALAQPAQETQRQDMPGGETSSHSDMNDRGRGDAPERPGRDGREDDRRLRGQFGRNDDESRGFDLRRRDRDDWPDRERRSRPHFDRSDDGASRRFDRGGRDRNDWRDAGERGHNGESDRDARDRPRSPMMGQGAIMMGHDWLMRVCGPNGDRISTLMVDRLERLTQPTEGQRATVDALKDAAARASEIARSACPTERPITPPGRLAAAEKRLEASLQAVRTMRPAMDAFYASLSDEQKARLVIAQARPWRWGGWHERHDLDRWGRSSKDFRSEGRNLEGNRWQGEEDDRSREHESQARGQNDLRKMPGDDDDGDGWPDEWQGRL